MDLRLLLQCQPALTEAIALKDKVNIELQVLLLLQGYHHQFASWSASASWNV
jgi:hypothetical protein